MGRGGDDGRDMAVRVGYLTIRVFGMQFGMWSTSKGEPMAVFVADGY